MAMKWGSLRELQPSWLIIDQPMVWKLGRAFRRKSDCQRACSAAIVSEYDKAPVRPSKYWMMA
jgi:hypothetical protein